MTGNEYKQKFDSNPDELNEMIAESLYRPYAMTVRIHKDE